MELILWRHADAEEGGSDAQRRLTAEGMRQAERVAAWLRARLPPEAVVLASPALRARQTAQALTERFRTEPAVGTSATPHSVLEAAGWPAAQGAVVVIGHQPTLGQTVALALTGRAADWSLGKGAAWWLANRGGEIVVRAVISPDLV
ncbi:MAG TPA: histidine phosphatase family protein [Burkholderiales bacterium]|nr:histidine phosphatase family protein [Burkholderiales bacterium]